MLVASLVACSTLYEHDQGNHRVGPVENWCGQLPFTTHRDSDMIRVRNLCRPLIYVHGYTILLWQLSNSQLALVEEEQKYVHIGIMFLHQRLVRSGVRRVYMSEGSVASCGSPYLASCQARSCHGRARELSHAVVASFRLQITKAMLCLLYCNLISCVSIA